MSNFSAIDIANLTIENTSEKIIVVQESNLGSILGNISVFISAFLLSCGGCLAIIFNFMRRSNCENIKCLCSECTRRNLDIVED
jgi:hypothetical protein